MPDAPTDQSTPPASAPPASARHHSLTGIFVRGGIGGFLMGFANIVPGISGGAMLLIVGVYPRFIQAMADLVLFRWAFRSLLLLGVIGMGAATSILVLAGPIKDAIVNHRWEMFSLFIGLRLGAVPLVWKLAKPFNTQVWAGVAAGIALTAFLAAGQYVGVGTHGGIEAAGFPRWLSLFLAGLIGASATLLPGMDGSYFLLLMGEYVPILSAIERFAEGLKALDFARMWAEMPTLFPVGLGVALGLGGVSVLLRWLLKRFPKPTLGVLLGVLVGAVVGLYPFREGVMPAVGEMFRGAVVTEESQKLIKPEDWPLVFFTPSALQVLASIGLAVLGLGIALAFSRIDPEEAGMVEKQGS